MKSKQQMRVTIVNQMWSYPETPFGVFECTYVGWACEPVHELARFESYEKALEFVRKNGWVLR